jgi:hypothetical protein
MLILEQWTVAVKKEFKIKHSFMTVTAQIYHLTGHFAMRGPMERAVELELPIKWGCPYSVARQPRRILYGRP